MIVFLTPSRVVDSLLFILSRTLLLVCDFATEKQLSRHIVADTIVIFVLILIESPVRVNSSSDAHSYV